MRLFVEHREQEDFECKLGMHSVDMDASWQLMHGIENDCCIHYGVWWGGGRTNGGGERHVVNKAGVGPVTA